MFGLKRASSSLLTRRLSADASLQASIRLFGNPIARTFSSYILIERGRTDHRPLYLGRAQLSPVETRSCSSNALDSHGGVVSEVVDKAQSSISVEDSTPTAVSSGDDLVLNEDLVQETFHLLRVLGASSMDDYDDDETLHPSTHYEDIDRILEAWSKSAGRTSTTDQNGMESAKQAESILRALEQNMDSDSEHGRHLIPDTVCYNKVLHAYAICSGGEDAAVHAHSILNRMLTRCRDYVESPNASKIKPPEPSARTFNIVINAWAKSGGLNAGSKAEEVFATMEGWARDCKENFSTVFVGDYPNSRSLCGVLDCWAQTKSMYAAERATVILEQAIERQRQRVLDQNFMMEGTVIKPSVVAFNSAIHAWVNSGQGHYGASQAENILKMMESLDESKELGEENSNDPDDIGLKPNTRTMSLVLDAWAQCSGSSNTAATRAQHILEHMEKLHNDGYDVKPNYISFTTCIKAWSRSKNVPDSAERAEALLDRLLHLHKTTGDEDFKPTAVTGNAVITAWARSKHPDSASRAKMVLQKLETFSSLDSYSYNSVIDAFAKKGDSRHAKSMLDRMEAAYKKGNDKAKPDIVTYNSVLNAMAKRRRRRGEAAIKAQEFLGRMEEMHRRGRTKVQPDCNSYTSVIECWARTNDPNQGLNAYKVLRHMIREYRAGNVSAKPDLFAFGRVLHACVRTQWRTEGQRRSALTTALRAFEELQQSPEFGLPQSRTYSILLTACCRLTCDYKERNDLFKAVFEGCCTAGKVSRGILEQAHRDMPHTICEDLLGTMVPEWSSNVPERDRP